MSHAKQAADKALTKQANTVVGRTEFAREFVTAQMAATIPPQAMQVALDLVIQLRALRSYYQEYLDLTGEAAVDLRHLPDWLAPGVWEAMNNNQKLHLEAVIKNEAAQITEGIVRAIAWCDRQLQTYSPDDKPLNEMLENRLNQYPSPD